MKYFITFLTWLILSQPLLANPASLLRSLSLKFETPVSLPSQLPDSTKSFRIEVIKNTARDYQINLKQRNQCSVPQCLQGIFIGTRSVLSKRGSRFTLSNGAAAYYQDNPGGLSTLTWVKDATNYQIQYFLEGETQSDRLKQMKAIAQSACCRTAQSL